MIGALEVEMFRSLLCLPNYLHSALFIGLAELSLACEFHQASVRLVKSDAQSHEQLDS